MEGETTDRHLARLGEHEPRLLQYAEDARRAANEMEAEVKEGREQTRSALSARDHWRAISGEVSQLHGETLAGKCECGLPWPCETWEVLQLRHGRKPLTGAYAEIVEG